MNQSSERLVVFVTPTQKRVLQARAARLGISLSELVRRAVLAFDDTGQEVRAAGLVDRLSAAQSTAAAGDTLRRLATAQAGGTAAASHAAQPAGGRMPARAASPSPASEDARAATATVAAAVARALEQEAAEPPSKPAAPETQALVARVIASETQAGACRDDEPESPAPEDAAPFPGTGRFA